VAQEKYQNCAENRGNGPVRYAKQHSLADYIALVENRYEVKEMIPSLSRACHEIMRRCKSYRYVHNRSRTNFSRTTGHSTVLIGSADRSSLTRRICAPSNISSFAQSDGKELKA
jgi:hypothetical protein